MSRLLCIFMACSLPAGLLRGQERAVDILSSIEAPEEELLPATSSAGDRAPAPAEPIFNAQELPAPEFEDGLPPPDSPLPGPMEDPDAFSFAGWTGSAEVPAPLPPFDLAPIFSAVSGDTVPPLLLSLRQVVQMALDNNPEIKVQRLQPELGEQQIQFARGAFDPQFTFSTLYSYSETPQNAQQFVATGGESVLAQQALVDQLVDLQNSLDELLAEIQGTSPSPATAPDLKFKDPRNFKAEDFSLNYAVGGLTPLGTTYQVGLTQMQSRNDLNRQIPPSLFYPEYTTTFGLTLTQPLLKNFGPAANLAELRVARVQMQIGWYEWQQQLIRSLASCVSLYVDLIYARENLRVREGAVDTARLLEEQNIRRVRAGKMRPSDVWEAQTSLANNADLALRAVNGFVESQNALKGLILSAATVAAGPTGRLEPVDALDVPPVEVDRDRFLREAFTKRPEYLRLQAAAEQEGIKVRFARNQVYPQVDLQASYGLTGLDGNFGDSFGGAFGGQGPAFSAGVVVSIPLGNQKERANLQAAKLRQEQVALGVQRGGIDITLEIDTAISLLRTTREQVKTAAQTARSARLTAEAQEKLLEEGKATTFDVVRLQNDYADARSRELAATANYRKAVVRLAVARGTLLDDLGINLEQEADKTQTPGVPVRKAVPVR